MKKGDRVWFVDFTFNEQCVEVPFVEYGILVEDKQNGYCIVHHYWGDFSISKDALFETKEDCEKFILGENK
ncbi:hypothetical protein IJE86_08035 [bacterium]|nr:hypothetical protein [bacterium]